MAEMRYLDIDVVISRVSGKATSSRRRYRAQVNTFASGQASTEFSKPVSDVVLENFVLRVGRARSGVRRIESPQVAAAKDFGASLFNAVFDDEVLGCLRSSMDEARRQGAGVRLRLHLAEAQELADLPWEYLYYPAVNRFLVLDTSTPVIRYLDIPERIQPLSVAPPLRILAMISSPRDYDALDVNREWDNLKGALQPLVEHGRVTLQLLEDATLAALQRHLRQQEYHVFHFIGHGGFDEKAGDGVLVLEDPDERSRLVGAQQLGWLLHNHGPLRLAVLNACEGARTSPTDPFAGTAQTLVQQGLPAVIAMQFEITDQAAITFSREFYSSLADGQLVDAAITYARMAIFAEDGNDIEWGTPVLYMRSPDGRIFDVAAAPPDESDRPEIDESRKQLAELYAEAGRLHQQEDWQGVIAIFNRIEELDAAYPDPEGLLSSARHELATEKQQARKLEQLYRDGCQHMEAGEWPAALTAFQEVEALQPLYRDVKARVQQLRAEIATGDTVQSDEVPPPVDPDVPHVITVPEREPPQPETSLSRPRWGLRTVPRAILGGSAAILLALIVLLVPRVVDGGGTSTPTPVVRRTPPPPLATIVHSLRAPGRLLGPTAIAVDRYGYAYVVDQKARRIQKFSPSGQFLAGYPAVIPAGFYPTSIAIGPRGTVSVTDIANDQIVRFSSSTGQMVPGFGGRGNGPGRFNSPAGIAADREGNIYVTDLNNHRIQIFSPTGQFRAGFDAEGVLKQPTGIAVAAAGYIYVTDQTTGYIQQLSPAGKVVASWGGRGTGPGRFHRPEQVAVDARGNVYVADTDNDRIQRFTSSGDFRDSFGGKGFFSQPSGVAVGPQGHIYVTDFGDRRVVELAVRP